MSMHWRACATNTAHESVSRQNGQLCSSSGSRICLVTSSSSLTERASSGITTPRMCAIAGTDLITTSLRPSMNRSIVYERARASTFVDSTIDQQRSSRDGKDPLREAKAARNVQDGCGPHADAEDARQQPGQEGYLSGRVHTCLRAQAAEDVAGAILFHDHVGSAPRSER